jgi:hypothetical protein
MTISCGSGVFDQTDLRHGPAGRYPNECEKVRCHALATECELNPTDRGTPLS